MTESERSRLAWTREQSILFECTKDAMSYAIAMVSAEMNREEERGGSRRVRRLRQLQSKMAAERASLYRIEAEALEPVRSRYNVLAREGRGALLLFRFPNAAPDGSAVVIQERSA